MSFSSLIALTLAVVFASPVYAEITLKSFTVLADKSITVVFASQSNAYAATRIDLDENGKGERTLLSFDQVEVHDQKEGFYTVIFREAGTPVTQTFFVEVQNNNFAPVNSVAIRGPTEDTVAELEAMLTKLREKNAWDRPTAVRSMGAFFSAKRNKEKDLAALKVELEQGTELAKQDAQVILSPEDIEKQRAEREARLAAAREKKRKARVAAERRERERSYDDYNAGGGWGPFGGSGW